VRHLRATGRYALEDLRVDLVAQRLVDAVRADRRLRSGLGARIAADDRERGTELGRTLLAVLRRAGDVRAVAEELSLHPNTVRQRLRRATETYGVDLTHPAQRLVLELELRAAGSTEPDVRAG
jgi:DNA-binding PucR family transcriptional regulator